MTVSQMNTEVDVPKVHEALTERIEQELRAERADAAFSDGPLMRASAGFSDGPLRHKSPAA